MSEPRVGPYRQLAEYYDRVFAFGRAWGVGARAHFLDKLLPRVTTICDIAAGTGTTALEYARRGFRVYTVDLSPSMCRQTRLKARAAGLKLHVQRADMRDFALPEPVDLILCEYDAINHVPEREDLTRVARCVSIALKPGGHFFFDANTSQSFREVWPQTWKLEHKDVVAILSGGTNDAANWAYSDVDWFMREGKLWRRARERVEEVCWTQTEIRATFLGAGFNRIVSTDAARFCPHGIIKPGHRTVYLARKARG